MGVETRRLDTRRPPLPAPTESMDEQSGVETEVATNVTTRTDKSSYSIPDDGSPITISTQKITSGNNTPSLGQHSRQKSQTSLLIEYFEASKSGDKSRNRPSVRVKVTPSSAKKNKGGGNDSIQITGIGKDRKPSYTRRISLGSKSADASREGTELSHSSESNVSRNPPVEIEVLNNNSDVSPHRSSRGLVYAPLESNVSSMPPDSMLEGDDDAGRGTESELSRDIDRDDDATPREDDEYLKAPTRSRSRSDSRERITQRVMEKLGATPPKPRKSSRSSRDRSLERDAETAPRERRRRSSKSHRYDDSIASGAESSLISSNPTASQRSYRSDRSQASHMTNNPKLLEMVEDTIKRVILPEINAIKEDRRSDRNLRTFERSRQGSITPGGDESGGLERRVSKSSSSPNIVSKPKVVLNRDSDNPGTVLSRGDSERVKQRKSSREYSENRPSSRLSSGRNSRGGDSEYEERVRHRSSKGSHDTRDVAAAGAALAGGALTAAALRSHDSRDEVHERRKRRSKSRGSRSRSIGNMDTADNTRAQPGNIPPMPLASQINDSEVTRESILSQGPEHSTFGGSPGTHTPIREVSRGSLGGTRSPASSRTPTRTPLSRSLGATDSNQVTGSPRSSNAGLSNKSRIAALAAAGLGTAALSDERHMDADGYGAAPVQHKVSSPAQSVSSLKKRFEDDESLVPQALRPRSAASRSSAARMHENRASQTSLHSADSSPSTKLARSRMHSRNDSTDEYETPQERRESEFQREGTETPSRENMEEWLERQHRVNDSYRDSFGEPANRDSYQTNPYPQDEKRFTQFTEDSLDQHSVHDDDDIEGIGEDKDVHTANAGLNPEFIHTPVAVESAVASLMEPSTVSSNVVSSNDSATKNRGSYSDRMAEQLRSLSKDDPPALYEGSTMSQNMPSQQRWAALKGYAQTISSHSAENVSSPRQSPVKSTRGVETIEEEPVLGASSLPVADDPMPEIGHFDDSKSITTNPSIIHGPLGGDATGNDTWPYTPEPQRLSDGSRGAPKSKSREDEGLSLAAGGAALAGAALTGHRANVEDEPEQRRTPDTRGNYTTEREFKEAGSPAAFRDEGYATDNPARSTGAATPKASREPYGKTDLEDYQEAMDRQDTKEADPFTTDPRHMRTLSGNSHGMSSPLYDSSTGNGIDRIQSKDIVALMDHLTVRDAQRSARDTELLVTLVRSTAEMRQSFDEIKRFITEQDKLIMQSADRTAEQTAQRVLGGPRPPPTSSPRTPRRATQSEEDIQTKRQGVLRRALKGLTGGKSARDLSRIEEMLMQVLDNVEDLRHQGGGQQPKPPSSYTSNSMDSYEKLRAMPDPGYEPEGRANTASTPSQSGHLPTTPREKQQFHSGYDGRRGSENRVSTVLEGDEDEEEILEPHESAVLNHQFENNEQLLTPTQEYPRSRGFGSPAGTPPQQGASYFDRTPKTGEKERKHKSTSSSIFGMSVPKVSRWSKTTASSAAPDLGAMDSPTNARNYKAASEASRSGSALGKYDDDDGQYVLHDDDRLRSTQSLAREQARHADTRSLRSQGSRLTRTPSPLIPSEASHRDSYDEGPAGSPVQEDLEDEHDEDDRRFEDPKYQAVRNSILLQHPQPRQGPTGRHQNTLETHAQTFEDTAGSNSDVSQRTVSDFDPAIWGSSATAGLARHRLTQFEPLSPVSMNSPGGSGYANNRNSGGRDEGPLVPQSKHSKAQHYDPEPDNDWEEPQFSNSGFSRGGGGGGGGSGGSGNYYSSPYGSGHLLEPIEEVRYSLETDRSNVSPEPQIAKAMPARKITGPRPMGGSGGSRSSSAASAGFLPHAAQPKVVDMSSGGGGGGTVRRKPVPYSGASDGSVDSETF